MEGKCTRCRGHVVDVGGWGVEVEVEMGLFMTWVGGLPSVSEVDWVLGRRETVRCRRLWDLPCSLCGS